VESAVLLLGFLLGGPIFVVSFIYTFIQSPIFQIMRELFGKILTSYEGKVTGQSSAP
jgi:uncharacterized membrane protein YczE